MKQSKRVQKSASDSAGIPLTEHAAYAQVVFRLDPLCLERIDSLADLASDVLKREVSRAMVVRAAVQAWLVANEGVEPAKLVEAIRGGFMARGRKSYKQLHLRIEPLEETSREEPQKRIRLRRRLS